MAAQDFGVVAIVVPDPRYDANPNARILNETYGFSVQAAASIQTLSANNPNNYNIIQGLLYVPDVFNTAACAHDSGASLPANVTKQTQSPSVNYPFIAIAPWSSIPCVNALLDQMRMDSVRGAIFYHPDKLTTLPPPVTDPSWSLQDGGRWQGNNPFPVYAIPGSLGAYIIDELSKYSGNISDAPYGEELVQLYNIHDTVRLFSRIDVYISTGIPSLWVFLIIVLAILLAIVLLTSVVMHIIQRRQRTLLQRRIANGEVDLEVLGIKRLNVPQDVLDKMPQYVYTSKDEGVAAVDRSKAAVREVPFSQPICPICLEDFVHGETTIRELPCNHIFHPECIDPFLKENSSLCPMCKKSALPPGFCPVVVTNLMVRRERLIRRVRARAQLEGQAPSNRFPSAISSLTRRVRTLSMPAPPPAANTSASGAHGTTSEMNVMRRSTMVILETVPPEIQAQGRSAVRAWRREQIANQQAQRYDEQANETRAADISRPLWRRVAGRFIPSVE